MRELVGGEASSESWSLVKHGKAEHMESGCKLSVEHGIWRFGHELLISTTVFAILHPLPPVVAEI